MSTVKDVMTTAVAAVPETAGYKDILTPMRSRHVSAVPVLDSAGQVTGVVSEADLLRKLAAPALPAGTIRLAWRLRERSKATALTAAELMTTPAVTIRPDAPVASAARLMQTSRVKRLPVVDTDGKLAGIVSRADVLSVFERNDGKIRKEVIEEVIAGQFQLDPHAFDVTVTSGIVTISGSLNRRTVALNLLGAIRHVEGVVGVRDRLAYPRDELSGTTAII